MNGRIKNEQVRGVRLPVQAEKIKEIRADVRDIKIDIIMDKVIIQGVVHKQIFFVDLEGVVRHFPEDVKFSTFIDIPGALPGMQAQVDVIIEHIKAELSEDGRSLAQKIILQIFIKVEEEVQLNVATDPYGSLVKVEEVIGENIKQEMVTNEVELPVSAIKISDIVATINVTDTEVIRDKVIVQGIIHKQVFFVDEENVERHVAEDISYSSFIDIPGAELGDNVQVNVTIELIKRELNEIPGDILSQEIVFEIFAKVHRTIQMNICTGIGPLIKLPIVIGEEIKQDLITSDIFLNLQAIKVKEILASFRDLRTVIINNKVIVQGILHKQIFYIDQNNMERHQAEDVQFSNFLDIPGAEPDHDVDFSSVIEDVVFELRSDNSVHQKVVVQYFVKVTEMTQINVVLGSGPLLKVKEVIGENTKQLLVEEVLPEAILPINISSEVIRLVSGEEVEVQEILSNTFCLPFPVVKVKSIEPTIQNVEAIALEGQILISGEVVKQITVVDLNDIVRQITEIVSFEFLIEVPGVTPDSDIDDLEIEIENLSFKLVHGCQLDQVIVFKFILGTTEAEQVQVITNVTGPEIVTEEVEVNTEVVIIPVTPLGEDPELLTFGPEPVENSVELTSPAAEILNIEAIVEDFTAVAIAGGVRFTGTLVKDVIYETVGGEEAIETEEVPFDITYTNPAVQASFNVPEAFVEINNIEIDLSPDGTTLNQIILLTFRFKVTDQRIITVLTDVTGPGIVTVTKRILILDVVGLGPTPVDVVVYVEIV